MFECIKPIKASLYFAMCLCVLYQLYAKKGGGGCSGFWVLIKTYEMWVGFVFYRVYWVLQKYLSLIVLMKTLIINIKKILKMHNQLVESINTIHQNQLIIFLSNINVWHIHKSILLYNLIFKNFVWTGYIQNILWKNILLLRVVGCENFAPISGSQKRIN